MQDNSKAGHRKRIKERFLAGGEGALTDEALLELLLSYAIPQKDLQPLVKNLMAEFSSLSGVLKADAKALAAVNGLGEHSAVLLKLVDWIRIHRASVEAEEDRTLTRMEPKTMQSTLFELVQDEVREDENSGEPEEIPFVEEENESAEGTAAIVPESVRPRRGTGLFGKALIKESMHLLPQLPDTQSLDEIRAYVRQNLHFNAEETRHRYSNYIVRRMFPWGYADPGMLRFARKFAGRQELGDVCYYRFSKAESLLLDIVGNLLLPGIGQGRLERIALRRYMIERFPSAKSIVQHSQAVVDVLEDSGVARADKTSIAMSFREILLPSFAFVLHSEFPEPGMYDIDRLESNEAVRAMLWNPDRILPALYELRNSGIISKVSEIDSFRQFTTKYNLAQVVEQLVGDGGQI
ncbi:MAG: DNA repair protein [Chloroflexi bacterium]|nr:DNA repair protein [Chloroflexota bacterium]